MIIGNNAECRNLSCCTRSRRNRAEFCFCTQCREIERSDQILKLGIWILVECPHRFRCINWRTTADRYDPVRTKFLHKLCALHNGLNARIWLYSLKQSHFHASFFQIIFYFLKETEAFHGTTANDNDCLFAFQIFQLR